KLRAALLGVVAVAAIGVTTASGETAKSATSKSSDSTTADGSKNVSSGLGAKDATADVTGVKMVREGDPGFVIVSAQITVKNNSSKRSDYIVTIAAESPDHKTQYGDTPVVVNGLEPGQTTTTKDAFLTTSEIPANAIAVVKEVQRTSSL